MQSRLRRARRLLFVLLLVVTLVRADEPPVQVLPLSFSASDDLDDVNVLQSDLILRALDEDDVTPSVIPFHPLRQTLVKELELDALFSFSFQPERHRNISDYVPQIQCDYPLVLDTSDVVLAPPLLMPDGRANYTAALSFDRAVGPASLTILFRRSDNTVYTSVTVQYVICGISFYHVDNGKKVLLKDNTLTIPSFSAVTKKNIQVFSIFCQFPDGSTTESVLSNIDDLPKFNDIETSVTGDQLIHDHNFATCVKSAGVTNGTVVLPQSCAFGFTPFTNASKPHFILRLLRYRTGTVSFHFIWHDFLKAITLDEAYETTLTITVSGTVGTSVVAIEPKGPFQKAGGQILRCTLANADRSGKYIFRLGNHSLDVVSSSSAGDLVTVSFISPTGSGRGIPWDLVVYRDGTYVSCPWASDESRFVFSYADEDITITSISPNHGPASGGTTITCQGYFGNFTGTDGSGDALMMGTYAVHDKFIVSVKKNAIVFKLPPKHVALPPSHIVECTVIVGGIRSNSVAFTYESLTNAHISVAGASYQAKNETYMIPLCARSPASVADISVDLFAHVSRGALLRVLKFEWYISAVSTKKQVLKLSGGSDAQSLSVSLESLSVEESYRVVVVVSDARFANEVTSSVLLQPTYSRMLGVGLAMDPVRTIASPPVDARISASVNDLGRCFGLNNRLTYEWTFLSKSTRLSYESAKANFDVPSPRRLGREYVIPRGSLLYGEHDVAVKIFYTDNPEAFGTAVGRMSVEPSALQAVIGSGETFVSVSASSDLQISGSQSFDPDEYVSPKDFTFQWTCDLSTGGGRDMVTFVSCPVELMSREDAQKESFTIPSSQLNAIRVLNESMFLRFSLDLRSAYDEASIGSRSAVQVNQIVEVRFSNRTVARTEILDLSGPDGASIDPKSVPYFDAVVLSPRAPDGVTWRFRLLRPAEEAFTFMKNPNNFLQLPGYYATTDVFASRRSLAIRQGVLKPGTEYVFQVESESTKTKSLGRAEVTLKTMAEPTVKFVSLSKTSGTTDTAFFATAAASEEYYSFKYYFFIKLGDGSEVCIDGCSGHRSVSFRVPLIGTHMVRCELVDARGKYVLARAKETYQITITSPPSSKEESVMSQSDSLGKSFMLGDHSSFSIEGISLARYAKTVDASNVKESEVVGELVSTTLEQLASLYRKTQTNTLGAKDYMTIAKRFALLPVGHEGLSTSSSFYQLCQMMYYAVMNTPASERYDMTEELNVTLTSLTMHARQMFSHGSSRGRLVQVLDKETSEVNEKLLELSELTVPLWSRVRGRDAACGQRDGDEVAGVARISTATFCNAEQGSELEGEFSQLRWCKDLFGKNGTRRVAVVLGEFRRDYIAESGVLDLRNRNARVPRVDNGAISVSTDDMASHGFAIVRTMIGLDDGTERFKKGCLKLRQRVRATGDVFASYGGGVICDSASGVEYVNTKALNMKLGRDAYAEREVASKGLNASDAIQRQATTDVTSDIGGDGHYGVKRRECKNVKPTTFGIIVGVWLPIVAVIGVCVGTVGLAIFGSRMQEAGAIYATVEEGDAAYIERDIYGRDAHGAEDVRVAVDVEEAEREEEGEEVVFEGRERRSSGEG